jgi:hypothetical protein
MSGAVRPIAVIKVPVGRGFAEGFCRIIAIEVLVSGFAEGFCKALLMMDIGP